VPWGNNGSGSGSFDHSNSFSGDSLASQISPIISDCEGWANFHRALRSGCLLGCFGLFKEMNSSFVAIISDEIWRFFETKTAQGATCIHIPLARHVFGLSAQSVRHDSI
jgi:hypothetical protein